VFSKTKVQFLHADEGAPQHLLATPAMVEGLRIAALEDLIAMKLKVVGDRGELRDYFDLMAIEQQTGRTVEEGLSLFLARFAPANPTNCSPQPAPRSSTTGPAANPRPSHRWADSPSKTSATEYVVAGGLHSGQPGAAARAFHHTARLWSNASNLPWRRRL
jgi:hypothetical protein